MAYQKVGTPRFYIDTMQYLKNLDVNITYDESYIEEGICEKLYNNNLSPENPVLFSSSTGTYAINTLIFENDKIISKLKEGNCYLALLNHNLSTAVEDAIFWAQFQKEDGLGGYSEYKPQALEGINAEVDTNNDSRGSFNPNKNGFSIGTFSCDETEVDRFYFGIAKSGYVAFEELAEIYIGGVSFGKYYDMPVNPDLDLSMSIEYDGFTNIKTLSGHTITQANYQGSPWWYDKNGNKVEPWSVGQSTGISKRNGRRVWKLKFSYMSDKDLFASNYGSSTYLETDLNYGSDIDETNMGGEVILDGDFSEYTSADTGAGDVDCGLDLTQWVESSGDDNYTITSITDGIRITSDSSPPLNDSGLRKGWMHNVTQTITGKLTVGKRYHFEFYLRGSQDTDQGGNVTVSVRRSNSTDNFTEGQANGTFNADTFTKFEYDFDCNKEIQDLRIVVWANNPNSGNWIEVKNMSLKSYEPDDFYYTIDNDDSFSAQVLNKISHGEKFIFQPDNTSNNPSDFAICVLDGDSFEMKRTAWNVYDIEMTIREVW